MNNDLGHDSALGLYWVRDNLTIDMNFVMDHAPGERSIDGTADHY